MENRDPVWIEPADPGVAAEARPRLSRQCRQVLARLREGPATNVELNRIASRFGARIHDLRRIGYDIELTSHDHATGAVWYRLRG